MSLLCKWFRLGQVSISPTFYEQLFRTKDFRAAFLYLHCRFKLFRRKEIGAKAAHKMLVKLTPGLTMKQTKNKSTKDETQKDASK